jgi:5-methyltetrahydrofolate--homocysteine methyltransferase
MREDFIQKTYEEYRQMAEAHANRGEGRKYLPLAQVREHKPKINHGPDTIQRPAQLGTHAIEVPVAELRPFIDWTPFFATWELRGKYPQILDDEVVGNEARKLLADANQMLDQIIAEGWLTARGTYGLFPANSVGDDIEVYSDEARTEILTRIHTLRQQAEKGKDLPYFALADYVAPRSSDLIDYVGGFAVTSGLGIEPHVARFDAALDDYNSILLKALADRLAEAFAEYLHLRVRREFWGYAPNETLDNEELIKETYRGIRPAPGYPACPDHTEKITLFALLNATEHTGIQLTENLAMYPAASVSGWYIGHPDARYFGVGKLTRDQLEDYATRKQMPLHELERWLQHSLTYTPEPVGV